MKNNTEVTIASPAPSIVSRYNSAGKATGSRITFGGLSATDVKKQLKEQGIKGKELTKRVDQVLRGEASLRNTIGRAYVDKLVEDGFVFGHIDANKKGNKAKLELIKVEKPIITVADIAAADQTTKDAVLAALLKEKEEADAKLTKALEV